MLRDRAVGEGTPSCDQGARLAPLLPDHPHQDCRAGGLCQQRALLQVRCSRPCWAVCVWELILSAQFFRRATPTGCAVVPGAAGSVSWKRLLALSGKFWIPGSPGKLLVLFPFGWYCLGAVPELSPTQRHGGHDWRRDAIPAHRRPSGVFFGAGSGVSSEASVPWTSLWC